MHFGCQDWGFNGKVTGHDAGTIAGHDAGTFAGHIARLVYNKKKPGSRPAGPFCPLPQILFLTSSTASSSPS
jgi:hypothetical protein